MHQRDMVKELCATFHQDLHHISDRKKADGLTDKFPGALGRSRRNVHVLGPVHQTPMQMFYAQKRFPVCTDGITPAKFVKLVRLE
jgi:hypothetical protein